MILSPRKLLEAIRMDVLLARVHFDLHQVYASPKSKKIFSTYPHV